MKKLSLFLAASLLAVTVQAGDIYRWKDANGSWHYSDQPVPGAERVGSSRYIQPSTESSSSAGSAPATPGPSTSGAVAQTTKKVREDVAADRAAKCKEAQANYQQTIASQKLYRTGPKGEQIFLTEDEIEAARVTARTNMEYYCGK